MAKNPTETIKKPARKRTKAAALPQDTAQGSALATKIDPVTEAEPVPLPSASQTIKDGAAKLARQATDKARDYVAEGKTRAGGALDEVSRLMVDAADTVDAKIGPEYGQYARTAAEGIAGFSESLKAKEMEDLLADATAFVKKSPVVAIGVAAALGFVVARLVKAGLDAADEMADGPSTTNRNDA